MIGDRFDAVELRLLREYGAMFVTRATPPPAIVFRNQREVAAFQDSVAIARHMIGGFELELQSRAMTGLKKAAREADKDGLSITPRGEDSARRSYTDTVSLWKSRVVPALDHWIGQGRMKPDAADKILSRTPFKQVPEVLRLEEEGIFFAKDLSKSILYSVAPPGTSQHLAMLAIDIAEFDDPRVREIMARNGWFQTVVSDLPHFTYLGARQDRLPGLGLRSVETGGRTFWVPDI